MEITFLTSPLGAQLAGGDRLKNNKGEKGVNRVGRQAATIYYFNFGDSSAASRHVVGLSAPGDQLSKDIHFEVLQLCPLYTVFCPCLQGECQGSVGDPTCDNEYSGDQ